MSKNENQQEEVDLSTASNDQLKAMGLPPRFTLDELKSFMSDEELERELESEDPLVQPENEAGEKKAPETEAEKPGADDEDDDGEDDEDGEVDDTPAVVVTADKAGEEDKTPVVLQEPDPELRQIDVSAHAKVLDDYAADRAKLRDAYNDGDLTDAEFAAKMDALTDARADAQAAIKTAQAEAERQQSAYAEAWYAKTSAFMKARPEFADQTGVTELGGESPLMLFDRACRYVNGEPAFQHMTQAQRIAQAEKVARDHFKAKTGRDLAPTAAPVVPKRETPQDKVRAQGQRPPPVQTLGGISAATETEVNNTKFSAVDNAVGLDAERAYSKMSEAEREAYLAGA